MDSSLLPIDIQSSKLTDWLVSRRMCDRHWVRDAAEVRRRIGQLAASDSLAQEGVSAELQAALKMPQVHYWHCDKIADALKRLDSANKSFLFGYSSAVIRELDAVLKVYKRGSCYLADASRLLNKLVQEEAPLLKRQAERARRRQGECERRKGELAAAGAEARAKFSGLCRQFGLGSGEPLQQQQQQQHQQLHLSLSRVRRDLIGQAEALPDWFDGPCMESVRALSEARRLYAEFAGEDGNLCPTLAYLLERGNTSQYEYSQGRAPDRVEPFRMALPAGDEEVGEAPGVEAEGEADGGEIDFGEAEIDFSVVESGEVGENAIDFSGIEEVTEVAGGDSATSAEAAAGAAVAGGGLDDGVARGEQARSVLDTLDLRERLLDDLHELDAFYARLVLELGDHTNCVSQLVLAGAPAAAAADQGVRVRALIAQLTEPSRQHLMLTRSAPSYLSRLLQRFTDLADQAEKSAAASRLLEHRRQEAEDEERSLAQQLTALRAQIAELKALLEKEVSQRCDNRRVNIMGEVNAV